MKFSMNCLNFLLGVDAGIVVAITLVVALIGIGGGIGIGILIYKSYAKKTVGGVKEECERIKKDAREESKSYLKQNSKRRKKKTDFVRSWKRNRRSIGRKWSEASRELLKEKTNL